MKSFLYFHLLRPNGTNIVLNGLELSINLIKPGEDTYKFAFDINININY